MIGGHDRGHDHERNRQTNEGNRRANH
jgi:hypothetical protein